jgi:arylsulfatase A-like enzyme
MLTGLSPRDHGASGADAALAPSVFTVAEAARQAGIVTAMFTANPSTTEPYGFARGWESFVSVLPGSEDTAATAIFEDVGRWLESHKDERFFVVIHARGGHPPWDVTSEELKDLPPANYTGSLEPKHAGEALAKARKAGGGRLFADPDRERAFALHGKALVDHDAALGALAARLRAMHRAEDTAWIVTGDIGIDATAHVPFLEDEALEEGALAVPLVVRAPGGTLTGRVATATSAADVAPTILEAFGLPPPAHLRGESLWAIASASGKRPGGERPLIAATTTRFSARWGPFAVVGARDHEVKVCDLSLDPDCVTDVRASHPLAAEALHALAWGELVAGPNEKAPDSRPDTKTETRTETPAPKVVADGVTSAALKVWGR